MKDSSKLTNPFIRKRVKAIGDELGYSTSQSKNLEYYVAKTYLHKYLYNDIERKEKLRDAVLGGGDDLGIDVAAVVVNGKIINDPDELKEILDNLEYFKVEVVLMQVKTGAKFEAGRIERFLKGIKLVLDKADEESYESLQSPQLKNISEMIAIIMENIMKLDQEGIKARIYYVAASAENNDGKQSLEDLHVQDELRLIKETKIFDDPSISCINSNMLIDQEKQNKGPMNVSVRFDRKQSIPELPDDIDDAFIGVMEASQVYKLLVDEESESGEIRDFVFEDNVRLDLGAENSVNQEIFDTLNSDNNIEFPLLNNGLTIVAKELKQTKNLVVLSKYQIVNGCQTSNQIVRWANLIGKEKFAAASAKIFVPVKLISSEDPSISAKVSKATNLQTEIVQTDIQGSSPKAKEVETFFALQDEREGLRYVRQRGGKYPVPDLRKVDTMELDRAVAAANFGKSFIAIGAAKDLTRKNSFVWGDFPAESYYYAAYIQYRVDCFFNSKRAAKLDGVDYVVNSVLPAKYHITMLASAILNPRLIEIFQVEDADNISSLPAKCDWGLWKDKKRIDDAIEQAVLLVMDYYEPVLQANGRLKRDEVKTKANQMALLDLLVDKSN